MFSKLVNHVSHVLQYVLFWKWFISFKFRKRLLFIENILPLMLRALLNKTQLGYFTSQFLMFSHLLYLKVIRNDFLNNDKNYWLNNDKIYFLSTNNNYFLNNYTNYFLSNNKNYLLLDNIYNYVLFILDNIKKKRIFFGSLHKSKLSLSVRGFSSPKSVNNSILIHFTFPQYWRVAAKCAFATKWAKNELHSSNTVNLLYIETK